MSEGTSIEFNNNIDLDTPPILPSKHRDPDKKYDEIQKRIQVIKNFISDIKNSDPEFFQIPEALEGDEHFWYIVMSTYYNTLGDLKKDIPNKNNNELRNAAARISVRHSVEIVEKERESATDPLTKAAAKGSLDNYLKNLQNKPPKNYVVGVALADIDHFKKVNDTMGHEEGNRLLIELVSLLQESVTGFDMIGRYGGEEFAIILPLLPSYDVGSRRIEVIRKKVEQTLGITVSIGFTVMNPSDRGISDIYKRADDNLYNAKRSGRNSAFNDSGKIATYKGT